jgi:hypothetical protein
MYKPMRIHNTEIFYRVRYCYQKKKLLTCTSAGLEADGSPHPADKITEIKKNLKK